MVLDQTFFHRPTLTVSRQLLGCALCRRQGGRIIRGTITETEAYRGPRDLASHASRGRTPRTAVMFGPPGYAYVYLVYGMYWCLNVVTERAGYPAAVLIRAAVVDGLPQNRTDGPGKICRALGIDGRLSAKPLGYAAGLWIESRTQRMPSRWITTTPRVGVPYAGAYRTKPWRFVLDSTGNRYSR